MNEIYKIQLSVAVICIIEAWLEEVVIKLKNPSLPNYAELNKQEHFRSAVWFTFLILGCCYIAGFLATLWVIPVCFIIRRLFFSYSLKLFRKNKKLKIIEGNQFTDNLARKIFGQNGGYFEIATCLLIIIGLNLLVKFIS